MVTEAIENVYNHEKERIDRILNAYDAKNRSIISLLQIVQEEYGYLPRDVLEYLSEELNIPLAEIYSVATFYTQFSFEEKGKYVITCCDGTACHVKGSPLLLQYIEDQLKIKSGETTEDKIFSLETVACLGCCAISPVCVINGQIYGNLTVNKLKTLFNKLKKQEQLN